MELQIIQKPCVRKLKTNFPDPSSKNNGVPKCTKTLRIESKHIFLRIRRKGSMELQNVQKPYLRKLKTIFPDPKKTMNGAPNSAKNLCTQAKHFFRTPTPGTMGFQNVEKPYV